MTNKTKRILIAATFVVAGIILGSVGLSNLNTASSPTENIKASDAAEKAAWAGFGKPHQPPAPAAASTSQKPAAATVKPHGDDVQHLDRFAPWDAKPKGGKSHE